MIFRAWEYPNFSELASKPFSSKERLMTHFTFKMLAVIVSSLSIFGLAKAEARAEKEDIAAEKHDEKEKKTSGKDDKNSKKELTPEEKFEMEQSYHRIMRDQRNVKPPEPLPKVGK